MDDGRSTTKLEEHTATTQQTNQPTNQPTTQPTNLFVALRILKFLPGQDQLLCGRFVLPQNGEERRNRLENQLGSN